MTFGITFSINFPDRLNPIICNNYNAKTSFLISGLSFKYKNRSKNHVCSKPFLGPPFSNFFKLFPKRIDLGTPSKSDRCQNGTQNQPSGAKMAPGNLRSASTGPFLKQHCARDAAWSAPGHIFHYFWRMLDLSRSHVDICSMILGVASYIKFWYSHKPPDTRNNAELQQRSCKKLLKQKTSKKLAKNLQRTSKKLMQRTFPKAKSQAAYSILRRDSNRNKHPAIK